MKIKTDKGLRDSLIVTAYEKYKLFINNSSLPSFSIRYKSNISDGSIAAYRNENGKHIITIDERFPHAGKNLYTRILFHEFTHLLDNVETKNTFNNNAYRYYTEFHAAKIAMIYLLGCENIKVFGSLIYSKEIIAELQNRKLKYINLMKELFNDKPNYDTIEYHCAHLLGEICTVNMAFPSHINETLSDTIIPLPYRIKVIQASEALEKQPITIDIIDRIGYLLKSAAIEQTMHLVTNL